MKVDKIRILNVEFFFFEYKSKYTNKINRIEFDSFRIKDDLIQLLYLGKYVLSVHERYSHDFFEFLREYFDEHPI